MKNTEIYKHFINTRKHSSRMRTARLIPPHVLQKPPDASTGGWSPQLNKFEQVFNDG